VDGVASLRGQKVPPIFIREDDLMASESTELAAEKHQHSQSENEGRKAVH